MSGIDKIVERINEAERFGEKAMDHAEEWVKLGKLMLGSIRDLEAERDRLRARVAELEGMLSQFTDRAANFGWAGGAADIRERAAKLVETQTCQFVGGDRVQQARGQLAWSIRALPLQDSNDD